MGGQELGLIQEAFDNNWVAPAGPHLEAFENEFAREVGTAHAVAVSSGTAALHLGLRWADVGPGDEVICSSLTFVASVNPVLQQGGVPVFVDSDERSWNMDPLLLAEAIAERKRRGGRIKAVVLVHLYGQSADLDPITELCRREGISLIEDAAEALGAEYWGDRASCASDGSRRLIKPGTAGLCGAFSFNGNKIITTSGGGMLVSADRTLIEKARYWATQARDPAPHYEHSELGYNYRLSNVLAGIGRGQLRVLSQRVETRRLNFEYYRRALAGLPGVSFMPEATYGRSSRWLTCLTIDPAVAGTDREAVRLALAAADIESRPVWKPMHRQPLLKSCTCFGGSVADRLFEQGLCLPSGSNLTNRQMDRIVDIVRGTWPR